MSYAPLFGYMGVVLSLGLSSFGAAYGTWKSSEGVAFVSSKHPGLALRSMIPIVIAGVLAIYGIIVAVLISCQIPLSLDTYDLAKGFAHLGAGLTCGLTCLAAGFAIGKVGQNSLSSYSDAVSAASCGMSEAIATSGPDAPLLGSTSVPNLGRPVFITMLMSLVFAEAIGLYGLVIALLIIAKA